MKALHLLLGATIALGAGDAAVGSADAAKPPGGGSGSGRAPSRKRKTPTSAPSSRRSADDILDLDDGGFDEPSFLDDDLDGLMDSIAGSGRSDPLDGFEYGDDDDDDEFDPLNPSDEEANEPGLGGGDAEYGQGSEKGALYDAYNLLHSLAQVSFDVDG